MTTIGMYYDVIPGKEEQFVTAVRSVTTALESFAGHVASRLFEDVNKKGSYVILSDWTDKQAFDAFVTSEAFRKVTNWGKENILRGRPRHTTYITE